MKKMFTILLTLMLSLSFFACSTPPDNNENHGNNPGNSSIATLEQGKREAIDGSIEGHLIGFKSEESRLLNGQAMKI